MNSISINYPSIHAGTEKSFVQFIDGEPDISTLYKHNQHDGARRFFVTDTNIAALPCMKKFVQDFSDNANGYSVCGSDCLVVLGAGEAHKTIENVLRIVSCTVDAEFSRKDFFVGIGGGVICDMTGFAASIFKRGAKCEFVPTTLLAMVDAAVGGKTGCDFSSYKNMIGAFFPARQINVFPEFITTLPESEYSSGLAEAVKTALLYDKDAYEMFKREREKVLARDAKIISEVVPLCVAAKSRVVEKDFLEKGERAFLNLGHTFGHALESVAGLGVITHGAAVAWGISRALALSAAKGFCSVEYARDVFDVLVSYGWDTEPLPKCLKTSASSSTSAIGSSSASASASASVAEKILSAMKKDKKNMSSKVRVILQRGLCDTFITEVEDEEILEQLKIQN